MYAIPIPPRMTLSLALNYAVRYCGKEVSRDELESLFWQALRDGKLEVRAHKYDEELDNFNLETVSPDFWHSLSRNEFSNFVRDGGNITLYTKIDDDTPRYRHAEVLTKNLEKWLGIKRAGVASTMKFSDHPVSKLVSSAPSPIKPLRGVVTTTKKQYSVAVDKEDYGRCIIGGDIKLHQLAALACDLSPPGELREDKLYEQNLYDSKTKIGLIFNKLRYAVDSGKIKVTLKRSKFDRDYISAAEGIVWLESEGISVSKKLIGHLSTLSKRDKCVEVSRGPKENEVYPFNGTKSRNEFIKKEMANLTKKGMRVDAAAEGLFKDNEVAFRDHGLNSWRTVKREYHRK